MKIIKDYIKWKKDNPDEGYQYDMIEDFLSSYSREDLQGLLEYTEEKFKQTIF